MTQLLIPLLLYIFSDRPSTPLSKSVGCRIRGRRNSLPRLYIAHRLTHIRLGIRTHCWVCEDMLYVRMFGERPATDFGYPTQLDGMEVEVRDLDQTILQQYFSALIVRAANRANAIFCIQGHTIRL